nr:hypothetical protein [Tanacetum cinerariifolium]
MPSNPLFANAITHAMRTEDVQDRIMSRVDMRLDEKRKRVNNTGTGIGEGQGVNLPSLRAAHLGRNEVGHPLYSSLSSGYGGTQTLINQGGDPHVDVYVSCTIHSIIFH